MKLLKLFSIVILLVVASSCTIHKRHYSKGYFISWNKTYKQNPVEETENIEQKNVLLSSPVLVNDNQVPFKSLQNDNELVVDKIEKINDINTGITHSVEESTVFDVPHFAVKKAVKNSNYDITVVEEKSKLLNISKAGFYSSCVFVVSSLTLMFLMLGNVFVAPVLFFIPLTFWLLGFVLTVFVFIRNRKTKHKDANYYAWLSLILLVAMLYPLLLLYALANFSMNMPSII
jgi:hypothetical protein